MTVALPESQPMKSPPRPPQFSLAALFIVTAVLAVLLGLIFAFPNWLAGPLVLVFILAAPAVFAVCVRFGPDSWKAFCLGALLPSIPLLLGLGFTFFVYVEQHGQRGWNPPPTTDQLNPYGEWLVALVGIGIFWRPIVMLSFGVAVLLGILCVNIRRFLLRRYSTNQL